MTMDMDADGRVTFILTQEGTERAKREREGALWLVAPRG